MTEIELYESIAREFHLSEADIAEWAVIKNNGAADPGINPHNEAQDPR